MWVLRVALASALLGLLGSLAAGSPANAARQASADNEVWILEVTGLIDPVMKDFLITELHRAEDEGVLSIVLQLDSDGSTLSTEELDKLAMEFATSSIVVGVWVGPSGASALGGAAELASVADVLGVSWGSRLGEIGENRLSGSISPAFGGTNAKLLDSYIGTDEAIELGLSVGNRERVSLLNSFLTAIDGFEPLLDVEAANAGTASFTETRFLTLPLLSQLFHTAASPELAYLAFAGGLGLLIFELFTAGVGLAGLGGALLSVMGSYGLASLPTRWWAIGLILVAGLALAIDIQTNLTRFYTAAGVLAFTLGSVTLYRGVSMSLVALGVGIVGAVLYAYRGMPPMVRSRFSAPTIGRQWLVGETGVVGDEFDPDGTVIIRDVPWRASTGPDQRLRHGDTARIVGIDDMILQVEANSESRQDRDSA